MKNILSICLTVCFTLLFSACSTEPQTADVQGKPALPADPNADSEKSGGPSFGGMQMDPTAMMLGRLDTNRDGKITKEEYPDGGDEEMKKYDADGDGVITREEIQNFHKKVGGLGDLATDPDANKEVKKK